MAVAIKLSEGVESYWFSINYSFNGNQQCMVGRRDGRGHITELIVNGDSILAAGETLPGIPFPESGLFYQFGISMSALSLHEETLAYGANYYEYLHIGNSIVVQMYPNSDSRTLDLPGQEGDQFYIDRQIAGYWNSSIEQFVIWFDRTNSQTVHQYEIFSRDGVLRGSGMLDVFYNRVQTPQQEFVAPTAKFVGGVVNVEFEKDIGDGQFAIDGVVAFPGQDAIPGKLFVLDTRKGASIYVGGDFHEYVLYVYENDRLYEIERRTPDRNGYINVGPSGYRMILGVYGVHGAVFELYLGLWKEDTEPRG